MIKFRRTLGVVLTLLVAGSLVFALALSHESPCGPGSALTRDAARMKAIVHRCYGPPESLRLEDVAKPVPGDDAVLVKVRAAAVNPVDWHSMRGEPYLMRLDSGFGAPEDPWLGVDFAGTVEAVGSKVTQFRPGDAVFGGKWGALAEYVSVRESRAIVPMPRNVTFEQAAAIPVAAMTALQGLRDEGRIRPGQRVLINGASGGVGTFAVQLAKAFGAHVTGVCSTRNVELVRSLGADRVIDYRKEDFTQGGQRYDLILDNVGNHALLEYRRVLSPGGTYVMVGGPKDNRWIGPMLTPVKGLLLSRLVSERFTFFIADLNRKDLLFLRDLVQSGKLRPVIDRRYALAQVPAAIAYLEEGHARGKVVITFAE